MIIVLLVIAYFLMFTTMFEQVAGTLLIIPGVTNSYVLVIFPYVLTFIVTMIAALLIKERMRTKKMKNNYNLNLTKLIITMGAILIASFIKPLSGFVFPAVIVYVLLLVSFAIIALIKSIWEKE